MVAGGFQTIVENWRVFFPPSTWFAFTFLSHKLLRWLIPELLIAILISSIALSFKPQYQALLIAQIAFYLTALYGWKEAKKGRQLPAVIYVPFYFCAMNLAALRVCQHELFLRAGDPDEQQSPLLFELPGIVLTQ